MGFALRIGGFSSVAGFDSKSEVSEFGVGLRLTGNSGRPVSSGSGAGGRSLTGFFSFGAGSSGRLGLVSTMSSLLGASISKQLYLSY